MSDWDGIERRKGGHSCMYEERWGKILNQLENITNKFYKHIEEGEKEGGHRDRIAWAEKDIKQLKCQVSEIRKGYWKAGLIGGVIGAVGGQSPQILGFLIHLLK